MSGCKRCGGNHYVVEAGAKRNCPNCVVEDSDDSVLAEAEELITSDRADVYGPWHLNASRIGDGWKIILKLNRRITNEEVALMMDWVKSARLIHTPTHIDSWRDKCGYSALGARGLDDDS
tara:strand:- start:147 stop:506 length:360 start_codon:yes stop_codon:yes gene_type:complete